MKKIIAGLMVVVVLMSGCGKPSKEECVSIASSMSSSSGSYSSDQIKQRNKDRETFNRYCKSYNYSDVDPTLELWRSNQ